MCPASLSSAIRGSLDSFFEGLAVWTLQDTHFAWQAAPCTRGSSGSPPIARRRNQYRGHTRAPRRNRLPRRKWCVSRGESNERAPVLAVPELLTSVSVRHECGKERVRDGLERGCQEAAAAVPSMNRAPPRGRHCGSRDGHGAAGLYPRPRSGRRDLGWGVQPNTRF